MSNESLEDKKILLLVLILDFLWLCGQDKS